MGFEAKTKVLCFGSDALVKGLEWAFDQKFFSKRRYSFFGAQLSRPPEDLSEFSIFVAALDIGQPVPAETLRKLPAKPGVCAFLQPTPQQLLSLAEFPAWGAVAWDGTSFERIAARVDLAAELAHETTQLQAFADGLKAWLVHQRLKPRMIEIVNAPPSWDKAKRLVFDEGRRVFTVGGRRSSADLKTPQDDDVERIEIRVTDGIFGLKVLSQPSSVQFSGDPTVLKPGDQIQIGDTVLRLKASEACDDVLAIGRRTGVFEEGDLPTTAGDGTIADVCREFLGALASGELRVSSGLKKGSIFFSDGRIQQAVAGSVSGIKALTRIFSWKEPEWRFASGKRSELGGKPMEVGFAELIEVHRRWRSSWGKLGTFMPPPQLKLRAKPATFDAQSTWGRGDYQVLAAVCEYSLVRDIFNNCQLTDVEILESLVDMRKRGLIEPATAPA